MSNLRKMDGSSGDTSPLRWIVPPSLPVCDSDQIAQVFDGGADREAESRRVERRGEAQPAWPFLYSYRDGKCYVNSAPRRSAYAQASDAGEALM